MQICPFSFRRYAFIILASRRRCIIIHSLTSTLSCFLALKVIYKLNPHKIAARVSSGPTAKGIGDRVSSPQKGIEIACKGCSFYGAISFEYLYAAQRHSLKCRYHIYYIIAKQLLQSLHARVILSNSQVLHEAMKAPGVMEKT